MLILFILKVIVLKILQKNKVFYASYSLVFFPQNIFRFPFIIDSFFEAIFDMGKEHFLKWRSPKKLILQHLINFSAVFQIIIRTFSSLSIIRISLILNMQ